MLRMGKGTGGIVIFIFPTPCKRKSTLTAPLHRGSEPPFLPNPPGWQTCPQESATSSYFVVDKLHRETRCRLHKFLPSNTGSPLFGSKLQQILSSLWDTKLFHMNSATGTHQPEHDPEQKNRLTSDMLAFSICSILRVLLMVSRFSCWTQVLLN